MNDLISRKAAIDLVSEGCQEWRGIFERCEEKLLTLPSAQPEVIRCKDCKHRTSYWGNCKFLEEKYHQSVLVDGDDFCSRAERREE